MPGPPLEALGEKEPRLRLTSGQDCVPGKPRVRTEEGEVGLDRRNWGVDWGRDTANEQNESREIVIGSVINNKE